MMEHQNVFKFDASDSKLEEFLEIGIMTHSGTAVTHLLAETARFPDNADSYFSPDTKLLQRHPKRKNVSWRPWDKKV